MEPTANAASSAFAGWFPVLTLILGFLAKVALDVINAKFAIDRERESRREARSDALRIKQIDFQMETLLDWQQVLADLTRCLAKSHYLEKISVRNGGVWGAYKLPADLDESIRAQIQQSLLLSIRVSDEKIRAECEEYRKIAGKIALSDDEGSADAALSSISYKLLVINSRVGECIRGLTEEQNKLIVA